MPEYDFSNSLSTSKSLIAAINAYDTFTAKKALDAGADVNFELGEPLRTAARRYNFAMARELFLRGGNFTTAMNYNLRDDPSTKARLAEYRDACLEELQRRQTLALEKLADLVPLFREVAEAMRPQQHDKPAPDLSKIDLR